MDKHQPDAKQDNDKLTPYNADQDASRYRRPQNTMPVLYPDIDFINRTFP